MDAPVVRHGLLGSVRPAIADLPESGIVELVNHGREKPGLAQLWIGEGDLPTPGFIADAAVQALRDGHTFYTHQRGIPPLRQGIADYLSRVYGVAVDGERVFVTVGGMQAIKLSMQALVGEGDEVAIVSPVWPNIYAAVEIMGGVVRPVPLALSGEGWRLDLDRLFEACGSRTRAIFINSPGNPTGWMMSRDDMVRVRDFARARGLWIVSDEVYGRLTYERDRAPSFLEIMAPDERLIVVNTFSKNWSMTGWRVGWVVASAELGQVYENLVQFNTSGTATFLQYGALAAIRDGEPVVQALRERCRAGRDIVCDALATLLRVRYQRPSGSFYLFFSVDGEPDSRALAFRLVDEANVGLAPGSAFGPGGQGYLRLCFAASHDLLERAMERLAPALR
ncbi:MAG: pyridoxal phosphate-dependent aminotransferase [Alphaproteobacteria bacterium]